MNATQSDNPLIDHKKRVVDDIDKKGGGALGGQVNKPNNRMDILTSKERRAAKQIAEEMKRYEWHDAYRLYESIVLTLKFLNQIQALGIASARSGVVVAADAALDSVGRAEQELRRDRMKEGFTHVKDD